MQPTTGRENLRCLGKIISSEGYAPPFSSWSSEEFGKMCDFFPRCLFCTLCGTTISAFWLRNAWLHPATVEEKQCIAATSKRSRDLIVFATRLMVWSFFFLVGLNPGASLCPAGTKLALWMKLNDSVSGIQWLCVGTVYGNWWQVNFQSLAGWSHFMPMSWRGILIASFGFIDFMAIPGKEPHSWELHVPINRWFGV